MGSAEAIGYEIKPCNMAQRGIRRVASSKPGAWAFSKVLHHADRRLFAWSEGRITMPSILAGLPVLMVTTTGAKTGQARTMPLLGVPVGPDLAIIGTNFGQADTPGWVYNLEADPHATIGYCDREVAVVARLADEEQFDAAVTAAAQVYPGYDKYRRRIAARPIRVFVLQPDAP